MKKEWLLLVGITVGTVLLALSIIRWYAPTLLGVPPDLQMVQTSREVVPFFDSVFRTEDYASKDFILQDPIVMRAKPMYPDRLSMGPNDLLGFRNRAVPNRADVVIIGDSQTYGNNAVLEESWPGWFGLGYADGALSVYTMAVGGWGAAEYLEMFDKAMAFSPRTVVVAFYTGNDPIDSLRVFSKERWTALRPEGMDSVQMPHVEYPPNEATSWPVRFSDGVETVFTPLYRFGSNQRHPGIDAGYEVMATVAERLKRTADLVGVSFVTTIIPTKEMVYQRKLEDEGIKLHEDYRALVEAEAGRIEWLETRFRMAGIEYVDVLSPLQVAALGPIRLYPPDGNGHPLGEGYRVIAEAVLEAVPGATVPEGLVATAVDNNQNLFGLIKNGQYHLFKYHSLMQENGWDPGSATRVDPSILEQLRHGRIIDHVDRDRFGPK